MENTYDVVRYPNRSSPETHPSRLAALAAICGRRSAPAEACRLLELGCGEGNNVAAMAAALPDSRFVGLDLAAAPIALGRSILDTASLSNVALQVGDIADETLDLGSFDYVVAHGVYAWVPGEVRAALLKLIVRVLTPDGVAFISYNAHPGCRLREALRDILRDAVRHLTDAEARIEAARAALQLHIGGWSDGDPFQAALKEEANDLLKRPPAVVFHDELGGTYAPQLLTDVVEAARAVGLDYLCDTSAPLLSEAVFPSGSFEEALPWTGGDWSRFEQLQDFNELRKFRRSVFVRAGAPIDRRFQPERLRGLHAAAQLSARDPGHDRAYAFVAPKGSEVATADARLGTFLEELSSAWPATRPLSELGDRDDLLQAVMRLYLKRIVTLSASPVAAVSAGERPCAPALARAQAAHGQDTVTSRLHQGVRLEAQSARDFLMLLDGTRDRDELARQVAALTGSDLPASIERCETALREFARLGLLVA